SDQLAILVYDFNGKGLKSSIIDAFKHIQRKDSSEQIEQLLKGKSDVRCVVHAKTILTSVFSHFQLTKNIPIQKGLGNFIFSMQFKKGELQTNIDFSYLDKAIKSQLFLKSSNS